MLAEVVEQLKKTDIQTDVPPPCCAEDKDVECDICSERKHKAIKSCLVCLNSYCENHLEQHENLFKGKRHNLMDATGQLQEMICRQHEKLLEIYCRTDQRCICLLCMVDEHKNHDTVSTAVERTQKQKQLGETQGKFEQQIQEREKKLQELTKAIETHKHSALTVVKDNELIFTSLMFSIERLSLDVTEMIRGRERFVVSQVERLLKQLEREIDDLRRRNSEMEQLSHTHDHIHFLQSFPSLPVPPGSLNIPNITVSSYDDIGKSVFEISRKLEHFCIAVIENIYHQVSCIQIIPTQEYDSRIDFLQYFFQFTLDPNTAHNNLRLSEENRVLTYTDKFQQYPDHPDRFDGCHQVLCRERVCGRCYWEVEWSGDYGVSISVSYQSINRKGQKNQCGFGYNDQSWSLSCSPHCFEFWHNNQTKSLGFCRYSRIGVFVDHSAGTLSFYSVSDTMKLIHTVQTTFTQPLYPGFRMNFPVVFRFRKYLGPAEYVTVKLCDII